MMKMKGFKPMPEEMVMERITGTSKIVDIYGYLDPFHDTEYSGKRERGEEEYD